MTGAQRALRRRVWSYYRRHGRHDLPWRKTRNPYRVLVSEVMLQQTQVGRVVPAYRAFIRRFPTVQRLARAPLRDVLVLWQGLGYNRRARALHRTAQILVAKHHGRLPRTEQELCVLPGVGVYTARAILTFAFDLPTALVETNIRTVLLHELVGERRNVTDGELETLAAVVVHTRRPREWQWALMDYGAYLKAQGVRVNAQSKHYAKQSTFKNSTREVRGAIVRALVHSRYLSEKDLLHTVKAAPAHVRAQLAALQKEGLIRHNGYWSL